MSHANAQLIERFYAAFARRDAAAMAACYHPQCTFSDPVFPDLDHDAAVAMWSMLCARAVDLEVAVSGVMADADRGKAHWKASYTYAATGRPVINEIDASFLFRDGLILRHEDRFDLYRWMRQALGPFGTLIGWLPPVQSAMRRRAAAALANWRRKSHPADSTGAL